MLNPKQSLIYGDTGQTVELYPPEYLLGAPSSAATYAVYGPSDDLDGTSEFSGTATADSVDTTFDANSGFSQSSNRDRCNLTATTNIATGRWYRAANSYSQVELVKVDGISSGAYVTAASPLGYDYASGDTFKGLRQTFTVDSTFIADETSIGTDWKVRWTYTIAGVQYRTWTTFDVVRAQAKSQVTGATLYEVFPDLRHEQYADLRGGHWEHVRKRAQERMDFDAHKLGFRLDQVRESDWNEALLSGMRLALAESGWAPPGRDLEIFVQESFKRYWQDMTDLKQRVLLDQGTSGGATQKGVQQLTFRR